MNVSNSVKRAMVEDATVHSSIKSNSTQNGTNAKHIKCNTNSRISESNYAIASLAIAPRRKRTTSQSKNHDP